MAPANESAAATKWKTVNGISLRNRHLACIRMVRANYCGNGKAHTRDGTRIDVYDPLDIQKPEIPDSVHPEILEAGWAPDGATFRNIPRWPDAEDEIVKERPDHFAGRTSKEGSLSSQDLLNKFPETLIISDRYVESLGRIDP